MVCVNVSDVLTAFWVIASVAIIFWFLGLATPVIVRVVLHWRDFVNLSIYFFKNKVFRWQNEDNEEDV